MYFTDFLNFKNDIINHSFEKSLSFFAILDNSIEFERILIQSMKRKIGNKEIEFLAIRDVKVKEQYQRKGLFKEVLNLLIDKNVPILIDDIVNQNLDNYLEKIGFELFLYHQNSEQIKSRFIFKRNQLVNDII